MVMERTFIPTTIGHYTRDHNRGGVILGEKNKKSWGTRISCNRNRSALTREEYIAASKKNMGGDLGLTVEECHHDFYVRGKGRIQRKGT